MAKTVTVKLGDEEATADIDNSKQEGDDQYGERGRAQVKLTVPEGLTGSQNLKITTDAGTQAILPVEVGEAGGDEAGSQEDGSEDEDSPKLPQGSSFGGAALAIIAALAAGIAFIGLNPQVLPAPLRAIFDDLRKTFHI